MAGRAASLMANMDTVAPGNNPIPPVNRALRAPRMERKFHFLLRAKSQSPYPMGNDIAIRSMKEPTSVPSSGESSQSARVSPNQSSPLRRKRMGNKRLKLRLINMFSLLGGLDGREFSVIGRSFKHQHKLKSLTILP